MSMQVVRRRKTFQAESRALLDVLESHQRGEIQPPQLYTHQVKAVLELVKYFDPNNRDVNPTRENIALVVLPTGCGKTGVAVLASYALHAARVLVITPSVIISNQIHEAYENFLLNRGIITENDVDDVVPSVFPVTQTRDIPRARTSDVMITNIQKVGGRSKVQVSDIDPSRYDLVIVDEAHHYPAPTWEKLINHFPNSKRLFLTATPFHNGEPIVRRRQHCYTLDRPRAVSNGIIRDIDELDEIAYEANHTDPEAIYKAIADKMEIHLNQHDIDDPSEIHQGMVLVRKIEEAEKFCSVYNKWHRGNQHFPVKCATYVGDNASDDVLQKFKDQGKIRTLVNARKLLEGFDHSNVSVLGIVRKVAPTSQVLFAQFVGRAVRKCHPNDPVLVKIVSHRCYNQSANCKAFEKLSDVDPEDEDDLVRQVDYMDTS